MPSFSIRLAASAMGRRRFLGAVGLALLAIPPAAWSLEKGLAPMPDLPLAPALRLSDFQGNTLDLAQFRGRVVLVNFWATWCPPCRQEFPSLGRARQLFKPEEFEILAVNVDEDLETARAFAGTPGFPVLLDPNAQVTSTWKVAGLPTSFIVDRQGRLAFSITGEQEFDDPEMVTVIQTLLQP